MREGRGNATLRNRHRRILTRRGDDCHLCGEPIDYGITDHLHPLSFQIDHIVPIARGGLDELSNLASSHRRCNRERGDKLLSEMGAPKSDKEPPPPAVNYEGTTNPMAAGVPAHTLPAGTTFVTGRSW